MSDETPSKPAPKNPRPRSKGTSGALPRKPVKLSSGDPKRPATLGGGASAALGLNKAAVRKAASTAKMATAEGTPPPPAPPVPPAPPAPPASAAPAPPAPPSASNTAPTPPPPTPTPSTPPAPAPAAPPEPALERKRRVSKRLTAAAKPRSASGGPGPVPAPSEPTRLGQAAHALVKRCEAELAEGSPQARRAARLHYEIARQCETELNAPEHAVFHYLAAHKLVPDDANAVRGARRTLIAAERYTEVLKVIDAEIRLSPSPSEKAALAHLAGTVQLDHLGSRGPAKLAFQRAADLDKSNPLHLLALERADSSPATATAVHSRLADLGTTDPTFRAAQLATQAQLLELHAIDAQRSPNELYEIALSLFPEAPDVLASLKRLAHAENRWRDLVGWLEREVGLTGDDSVKTMSLYRIARLHTERLDSRTDAIDALERAARISPTDTLVLEEQARLYEADERWESLVGVLSRKVVLASNDSERLSLLQRVGHLTEHRLGRPDDAARWHAQALELDPLYVPSLHALGTYLRERNRWQELVLMLSAEAREARALTRRTAAHIRIAEVFEAFLGDPLQAASHYAKVLALDPGHTLALEALLRLYRSTGRWRETAEVLKRAIETPQLNVDTADKVLYLYEVGSIYEDRLDEPDLAIEAYRAVLAEVPEDLRAVRALGRAARRGERSDVALEALDREVTLTSDTGRLVQLDTAAAALLAGPLGEPEQALGRYEEALRRDPAHRPALSGLGRVFYNLGRWEDLLDVYRREQKLDAVGPEAVKRLHKMGEIALERLGDPNRAAQFFDQAARLDPKHAASTIARSAILTQRNRWQELAEQLDRSLKHVELPRDKARTAYQLGVVAEERLFDPQRATAAYEKALNELPDYLPAAEALHRLRATAGDWPRLITDLQEQADAATDSRLKVASLMLAGELWRDRMKNTSKAAETFEAVLAAHQDYLPALLALVPLYRQLGRKDQLALTYAAIVPALTSPQTRGAFLAELARVIAAGAGDAAARRATLEHQLATTPGDLLALMGLEELALEGRDRELLVTVDRALMAGEDARAPLGDARVRLAESLEMGLSPDALETYKAALTVETGSLAAAQGYARIAEDMNVPEAQVEALDKLAELQTDGVRACRYLVKAAGILVGKLADADTAIELLTRAIDLAPGNVPAASKLSELLRSQRSIGRLVDVLSRAAVRVDDDERACALWIEVAQLQAGELATPDSGAAIASLERVLRLRPDHLEARALMAEIHEANNQWRDATTHLIHIVAKTGDAQQRQDARLRLASLYQNRLDDLRKASSVLQELLVEEPDHLEALEQQFRLNIARNRDAETVESGLRLLELLRDPFARARVQSQLGQLYARQQDWGQAEGPLLDAIAVQGPEDTAASTYLSFIDAHGDYGQYAGALARYIDFAGRSGKPSATVFHTLSRIQRQRLDTASAAIETLRRGVQAWPDDVDLRGSLAELLKAEGQAETALEEQLKLVAADLSRAESWRELAATFFSVRRRDEARVALGPLVLLGAATNDERGELSKYPPKPGHARPGAFGTDTLRRLGKLGAQPHSAEALVQLLSYAVHKLDRFKPNFADYGLGARDRITSRSSAPERELADRIAAIFGVDEFDLYIHPKQGPLATVEPNDKPAVMVAGWAFESGQAWSTYGLAYAMAHIALQLHPMLKVKGRDLPILLASAGRTAIGGFGEGLTTSQFLESQAKAVAKAMPRRNRKDFEAAAFAYASASRTIDLPRWGAQLDRAATRAAALLCDDLKVALLATAGMRRADDTQVAALISDNDEIRDLLAFWVSEEAHGIRKRSGLFSRAL